MTRASDTIKKGLQRGGTLTLLLGALVSMSVVLSSGYMIRLTNVDTFCTTCHVMQPFASSWRASVHGGQNSGGVVVQCVSCHLPAENLFTFLTAKIFLGSREVMNNISIDGRTYDWGEAAEKRDHFTWDSACLRCHGRLTQQEGSVGELHRESVQMGQKRRCMDCHPHVGHKDAMLTAELFFRRNRDRRMSTN